MVSSLLVCWSRKFAKGKQLPGAACTGPSSYLILLPAAAFGLCSYFWVWMQPIQCSYLLPVLDLDSLYFTVCFGSQDRVESPSLDTFLRVGLSLWKEWGAWGMSLGGRNPKGLWEIPKCSFLCCSPQTVCPHQNWWSCLPYIHVLGPPSPSGPPVPWWVHRGHQSSSPSLRPHKRAQELSTPCAGFREAKEPVVWPMEFRPWGRKPSKSLAWCLPQLAGRLRVTPAPFALRPAEQCQGSVFHVKSCTRWRQGQTPPTLSSPV